MLSDDAVLRGALMDHIYEDDVIMVYDCCIKGCILFGNMIVVSALMVK